MTSVSFTEGGPPEIVLPPPPVQLVADLEKSVDHVRARSETASVVSRFPAQAVGWATLGELVERQAIDVEAKVQAYAYFRIGYHRGLDALRQNGWKGSGYVRWKYPSNEGFLRCLDGLRRMATAIGEIDEATRCADFLQMLDP